MARVLAVGGCHWDIRYVGKRELIPGESTPATSKRSPGGAVSNVARTLRGLGHQVSIASVVGNTPSPEDDLRLFGHVPDLPTASYVTVEYPDGSLAYGLADMEIYAHLDHAFYAGLAQEAAGADLVLVDCNAPGEAVAGLLDTGVRPVGIAVSPAKVGNFEGVLDRLSAMFMNAAEAEVLGAGLGQLPMAVVTSGADGARLLERGQQVVHFPAPDFQPAHVNGLGDRLAGLTLDLLMAGASWAGALEQALERLPKEMER